MITPSDIVSGNTLTYYYDPTTLHVLWENGEEVVVSCGDMTAKLKVSWLVTESAFRVSDTKQHRVIHPTSWERIKNLEPYFQSLALLPEHSWLSMLQNMAYWTSAP